MIPFAESAICIIDRGKQIIREIQDRFYTDSSMYTIFLFSEDHLLNLYTIQYLPVFRMRHRISGFVLVIPQTISEDNVAELLVEARVPYVVYRCDEAILDPVSKYGLNQRILQEARIVLTGSVFRCEDKVRLIIGCNGLTEREIAAYSILQLTAIPTQKEIDEAALYRFPKSKRILWDRVEIPQDSELLDFPLNVEYEISRLYDTGHLSNKRIAVFTVTKSSGAIIHQLSERLPVEVVLDNNADLWGTMHEGVEVRSPDAFAGEVIRSDWAVIVPTRSYRVICEQLWYLGFELGKQVFVTYREPVVQYHSPEDEFRDELRQGEPIYQSIREKYPDEKIYLAPYPGTGDMYLIGMYLDERMKADQIGRCVLVVPSNGSQKVFDLFDFGDAVADVIALNGEKETHRLLIYAKETGLDKCNLSVLNDAYDEVVNLAYVRGLNGIDFNTMFQKTVFFSHERKKSAMIRQENSDSLYVEYGLPKGKTVVLSPFANTTKGVGMEYWRLISDGLKKRGYTVCTNVAGSELPIEDTVAVSVPYIMMIDFLDKAGGFIALRSGLCDIVSSTITKKIFFYPPGQSFINSSYYEYFSLEKMGIAEDNLWEWIAEEDQMPSIIDEVINLFPPVITDEKGCDA